MGREPDWNNKLELCVSWVPCLVPGSAKLIFPGTHIIGCTFFVANSNLIELTSLRIERSKATRQVDRVETKSFESTTRHKLTSVPSSSSTALSRTFPSSIASAADEVSAEVAELTGRCDLCEFRECLWETESDWMFPKRSPTRCDHCPWSSCLLESAKIK